MNNLQELFHHMLMDVYYAEKKILQSLPKMAERVTERSLAEAFLDHRRETEVQLDRLTEVFQMIGERPAGETCEALDGLVAEAEEVMRDAKSEAVRDAGLLAAAQAVEHYEIARYGTLVAWAKEIGLKDAARLLQHTLDEEQAANGRLDALAMAKLNKRAA